MQEIAFQSIRNKKFSERGMPPDPPGGVNPVFKNILDPPLRVYKMWYRNGVFLNQFCIIFTNGD